MLNRGLELYLESAGEAQLGVSATNRLVWLTLGADLLKRSVQMMEHFYVTPTHWARADAQLKTARSRSRELSALILQNSASLPQPVLETCYGLLLTQGALLEENAAQSALTLEKNLNDGLLVKYIQTRTGFGNQKVGVGYDWSMKPSTNLVRLQNEMLEKRTLTGPLEKRMEAMLAAIIFADSNDEVARWVEKLADLHFENEQRFVQAELDDIYWRTASQYLFGTTYPFGQFQAYSLEPRREPFQEKLQRMKVLVEARKPAVAAKATAAKTQAQEQLYLTLKKLLQEKQDIPVGDRGKYILGAYTPEQARDLLTLLLEYEKVSAQKKSFALGIKYRLEQLQKGPIPRPDQLKPAVP